MKNILIFLFGVAVGAGGTILWLRKDIKEELNNVKNEVEEAVKAEQNIPFTMDEDIEYGKDKGTNSIATMNVNSDVSVRNEKKEKTPYSKMFRSAEEDLHMVNEPYFSENLDDDEDPEAGFIGNNETDGGVFEIDKDDFEHDSEYGKEQLVYFRGDRIMSTENGMPITNPFILVGGEWEHCVGNYADRTAFIRNSRLNIDYEILVEDGLYSEEYGSPERYRED